MRLFMLAVVAILSLPASGAAQQSSIEIEAAAQTETTSGANAEFAPPRAVDHVVVMSVNPQPQRPSDVYRAVVTRSGDWMRVDENVQVEYSNAATGVSVTIVHDEAGRPRYLHARRDRDDDQHDTYTRVWTGERDTLLGETCEIWRTVYQYAIGTGCVTRDGVELWRRTLAANTGEVTSSSRATAVVRRRIRAEDVRPPGEVSHWEMWRASVPPSSDAPNDEVVLTTWGLPPIVTRRRGGWTYRVERGRSELKHNASGLVLRYLTDDNGSKELTIEVRPDRPPVNLDRTETVLGETCAWFDLMPGVFDAGLTECRTNDGKVLQSVQTSWGRGAPFKATSIRYGVVSEADMQPPPDVFAWLHMS